mgnify:CR=1 FL=1
MKDYERTGILTLHDIQMPLEKHLRKGVAIIECVQEIPCNPCVDICPLKAISMENINALPKIDYEKCIGCGKCVEVCPGLAIFLVKIIDDKALVNIPYEFLPLPKEGSAVKALNREGKEICDAVVKKVKERGTPVVIIELPAEYAMEARNIRIK